MAKSKSSEKYSKKVKNETQTQRFIREFKDFVIRGNVLELMTALTVGTAFTKMINSLVNNLIMPPISMVLRGDSFRDWYISLDGKGYESLEAAQAAEAPLLLHGQLLADSLDFIIIALAIFFVIKLIYKLRVEEDDAREEEKSKK